MDEPMAGEVSLETKNLELKQIEMEKENKTEQLDQDAEANELENDKEPEEEAEMEPENLNANQEVVNFQAGGIDAIEKPVEFKDIPEELQLLILSYLNGRNKDLLNCTRAWNNWSELLHPQKTTFLSPAVLSHLLPYLNFNDILNCRATCKNWKSALDYTLSFGSFRIRDPPANQFASLQNVSPTLPHLQDGAFITFTTSAEIDAFTARVDACNVPIENPFVWRAVAFQFKPALSRRVHGERGTQAEYQQFFDKAQELMTRFGEYIWRFRYTLPDVSQLRWPHLTFRCQLLMILGLVKNIRSLELLEELPKIVVTDELTQGTSGFPRLSRLKELHFPEYSVSFTRFMHQLVAYYGSQLNTFVMHGSIYNRYAYWLPRQNEMIRLSNLCPNLMHLAVRGFTTTALWQLAKCTEWKNLRQFEFLVVNGHGCRAQRGTSEIWWLLKVMHQMARAARNLEYVKVDLKEPADLPFILYKNETMTINGTYEQGPLRLRIPIEILVELPRVRRLNVLAYKKTPIDGFQQFVQLKDNIMPLSWFWDHVVGLQTITIDTILFDSKEKTVVLSERKEFEMPRLEYEEEEDHEDDEEEEGGDEDDDEEEVGDDKEDEEKEEGDDKEDEEEEEGDEEEEDEEDDNREEDGGEIQEYEICQVRPYYRHFYCPNYH